MSRLVTRETRRPAATDRGREVAGRSGWLRVKSLLDELPRSTRAGNMLIRTKGRRWSGLTGPT